MVSDPFINPPLPIGDRTGGGNYYQRPKRPPMPVPEPPLTEPTPTAETPPDPNQMLLEALDRLRATDEQPQQPGTDTIRLHKARKAYQESGTGIPAPPTPPPPDPAAQADYDRMFGPE